MSILLCSLHIVPISDSKTARLQQFYSKCTLIIIKGFYGKNAKRGNNVTIRRKYGLPTIDSILKTYMLRMYYKWTLHFAYDILTIHHSLKLNLKRYINIPYRYNAI